MSIRVALIGANHWHSLYDAAYLGQLKEMPDVRIVGIQDDDPEIASHRAEAIGGAIATFTSYGQMLSESEPDFVLLLGRPDQMAEVGHDLLDARIPFLVEKPGSFTARQLLGVVEKAEELHAFAAVPLFLRYLPLIEHARKRVVDRSLGSMCHFYVRLNRPTSARYAGWGSGWMLDPKFANGGCLRNLGGLGMDCFVYLTGEGEDIDVTGAQLSWSTHGQYVEDYASVLVRSGKGVLGTIEVGNVFPTDGRDAELKVAFENGLLKTEGREVQLYTADGVEVIGPAWSRPPILRWTIEAAFGGGKPPVSVRDCYHAVRLIDLAYLAAGNPYGTAEV